MLEFQVIVFSLNTAITAQAQQSILTICIAPQGIVPKITKSKLFENVENTPLVVLLDCCRQQLIL